MHSPLQTNAINHDKQDVARMNSTHLASRNVPHRGQLQSDCVSFWYINGAFLYSLESDFPTSSEPPPPQPHPSETCRWSFLKKCSVWCPACVVHVIAVIVPWGMCLETLLWCFFKWEFMGISMSNANAPPNPPSQCWCWGSVLELSCSLFWGRDFWRRWSWENLTSSFI